MIPVGYLDAGLWTMPTPEHLALQHASAASAPVASICRSVTTLTSTCSIDLALLFSFRVSGRRKALAYRYAYSIPSKVHSLGHRNPKS